MIKKDAKVEIRIDERNHRVIYIRPYDSVYKNTILQLDGVLCINLARSKDRWENMLNEQYKTEYKIQRFEAVDGNDITEMPAKVKYPPNTYACLLSHIGCLEYAKANKWQAVLILEDDAVLVPKFDDKLRLAMGALPDDWDGLWLNGTEEKPSTHYNNFVNKLVGCWGAFGYIIRDTIYATLITGMKERLIASDDYYRQVQHKHNCFIVKERLVKHRDGMSVRENRMVSLPHLK